MLASVFCGASGSTSCLATIESNGSFNPLVHFLSLPCSQCLLPSDPLAHVDRDVLCCLESIKNQDSLYISGAFLFHGSLTSLAVKKSCAEGH